MCFGHHFTENDPDELPCSNGIDDDGDGRQDFPRDSGVSPQRITTRRHSAFHPNVRMGATTTTTAD